MGNKIQKYVEILALTSQIQDLKILFAKQSTYQDINKNRNFGKTRFKNSGNTWKLTTLIFGESRKKEKNRRTFHWCTWNEYWTATHNSKIAESNMIPQQIIPTEPNLQTKSLKINLASVDSDKMTDDIFVMTASVDTNYRIASDEIDRIFNGN